MLVNKVFIQPDRGKYPGFGIKRTSTVGFNLYLLLE